jgi:hypothetical protein
MANCHVLVARCILTTGPSCCGTQRATSIDPIRHLTMAPHLTWPPTLHSPLS